MILEKLGVPDNIIESGNVIWNKTLNQIDLFFNVLKRKDVLSFKVDFLKIGEYNIKDSDIKINLSFNNRNDILLNGMSISTGIDKKQKQIGSIKLNNSELKIIVSIGLNRNFTKSELINFIIDNKIELISSYVHELKHYYDYSKVQNISLKSRMDYIDMNILYSKSMSFNYFLYYLYLSHSTEIVVKPSEVLSELKLNNVRKKDFEQFLIKNSSYNNFKDMKNFSLELFLKNLRKEIIENSQYKSNNYTDEQINYLINFFLSEKLNDLINYKIDILKSHLIKIDPIVLSKNSDQLDKIYNKIKNISLKYKNNCIDFYKDQIKFINIVGEKNMKKLSKLYDILEY